jgi:hypothetical protein
MWLIHDIQPGSSLSVGCVRLVILSICGKQVISAPIREKLASDNL